jgi:hypothetical protein
MLKSADHASIRLHDLLAANNRLGLQEQVNFALHVCVWQLYRPKHLWNHLVIPKSTNLLQTYHLNSRQISKHFKNYVTLPKRVPQFFCF